jgi:hypothetical protein
MCSIFKPSTPLAKVVEDIGKLGKGRTEQDRIVHDLVTIDQVSIGK